MATRRPFINWEPVSAGDVLIGNLLYFESPKDGTFTSILRSHGFFFRLPPEVSSQIKEERPHDGALVVIEFTGDGYTISVLWEYERGTPRSNEKLSRAG